MNLKSIGALILCTMIWTINVCKADSVVVDKVYHPYVLANEREVEWRLMSRQNDDDNELGQRLGFGHSISENIIIEAYIVGERDHDAEFSVQAYEVEARWMVTQQGQYWADVGMLFELEKEQNQDVWEASSAILLEKEFGKTSLTTNVFATYEFGTDKASDWETELRMKYRYRYRPLIQPAIEMYISDDFFGIGPAVMGIQRFSGQKQLKWEAAIVAKLSDPGSDYTVRFSLEYEF